MKKRLLAMLMALAMVLAYMPAMAFAEDEEAATDFGDAAVEEFAEEAVDAQAEELTEEAVLKDVEVSAQDVGDWYESENETLIYEWMSDGTAKVITSSTALSTMTSFTIPGYVYIEGVKRTVTSIDAEALYGLPNLTSVTVPSTITYIGDNALGYYSDSSGNDVKVSGFTIFGITGTAAQSYATANGFTFRDPDAEAAAAAAAAAEAARQGTPDSKIPKVKISKPKAGKKNITVLWKKLSKKQLKKSKATKYEVWICANKGFASGETSEHLIKKSKTGVKITKVPKGTYFVKVRAVRYVGSTKMVGPWSKVKKVKVKK